ncbi:uncharacterized protein G2W53_033658 [Senna tora]|uniref:Uncharacterized protein n=1 Tax=Senna tora TaxID=362788 RepID=A0A834T0H4_9FABA|nr:uncharacterized protein G2W53_033658 [Senna tora]
MGGAWMMSQHIPDDKSPSDLRNLHELRGKRLVAQVSQTRWFANRTGFDAPIGVVLAWEERGSCLNIFRMTNLDRISETFTNYEAKDLLRNESNTSVRVVFVNRTGFDAPIGVVLAWEERGSCLNIFRTTNLGRISETFTIYEAKDLLRKRVKHVGSRCIREPDWFSWSNWSRLGMGGAWIMSQHIPDDKSWSDLRKLHELRGKRLVAQVSQTRRFAFYSRTGVVLMLQLESSWYGRSVDHVSTYSRRQSRSDLRNLHELRGKRLVAQLSQTRRFALYSRTGVVLMLQLESSWHGRSVDHVSTYFGRQIAVGSQKLS